MYSWVNRFEYKPGVVLLFGWSIYLLNLLVILICHNTYGCLTKTIRLTEKMINIILACEVQNHNEEANRTLCDWYEWKSAALVCFGAGVAKEPWRFLLQLLCHFMIGWIVFQLIITIITGMFLLGILLFYPEAFFLPVVTPEKLNHFSFELWSFFKLCIWHYGVIAGFLFMLGYTITKGLKLARCLKRWCSS